MAIMLRDQLRRTLKALVRDHHHVEIAGVHHRINARAQMRDEIAAHQVGGQVTVVREGLDCDGNSYIAAREIAVPTSLIAFEAAEDRHRDWLDGIEVTSFAMPRLEVSRAAPISASNDDAAAARAA